ncbi:hypothetical protein BD410DRAFT_799090 [Rickenella mellea]|uniref:Uncharacterized protein n=1 Tax=Rickenella mellea TaxID=50990 RepID=A0A4Y7QNI4_9AGAM|nr:hypothetical protein BD410DRAFT_799090 [Rickenella mellea]
MPTRQGTTYQDDSASAEPPSIEAANPASPGSPATNVDTQASTSVVAEIAGNASHISTSSPLTNVDSQSENHSNALGVSLTGSNTAVETRSWASIVSESSNVSPLSQRTPSSDSPPSSQDLSPSSFTPPLSQQPPLRIVTPPLSQDSLLSRAPALSQRSPLSNETTNEVRDQDGFVRPRSPARAGATQPSTPISTSPRYFHPWFDGNVQPVAQSTAAPRPRSSRVFDKSFEEYDEEGGLGDIPADWQTTHSTLSLSVGRDDRAGNIFDALSPTTRQIILGLSPTTRNKVLGRVEAVAAQTNPPDDVTSPATTSTANGGRETPRIPAAAKGKRADPRNRRAGNRPGSLVDAIPSGSQQALYGDEILAEDARLAEILQEQWQAETAAEDLEAARRRKREKKLRQARGDPPPPSDMRRPRVPTRQGPPPAVLTPEVVQGVMIAPRPPARESVPRTHLTDTSAPATTARPARA